MREAETILEVRPPSDPTRDDELEYMDWLEKEFRNDKWFTPKYKRYMASPKRWPWKNHAQNANQYRFTFTMHTILGGLLTWPFAVWVARRKQRTQTGVPKYPIQRFVHDFPNVDPSR